MVRTLGLAVGLVLSAMPVLAQMPSATEERIKDVYAQLGYDVGYHLCDGLKSGTFTLNNPDRLGAFMDGRLSQGEIELSSSIWEMDENSIYREVFLFNMWRSMKHGGCENF